MFQKFELVARTTPEAIVMTNVEKRKGGRPRRAVDERRVVQLREIGTPWRKIARQLGLGTGTVVRAYQGAAKPVTMSQNSATEVL